jgi:hypothetical protein
VVDGDDRDAIARFYEREFGIDATRVQRVVLIEVIDAKPVISPAYDRGLSEDEVRASWEAYSAERGRPPPDA